MYYKFFDSNFLNLKPSNEMLIATMKRFSESSFEITGETTPLDDSFEIIWNSKDEIHHGYMKHNVDNNFEGRVLEFIIESKINVVGYENTSATQMFILENAKGEIFKEQMIKFASTIKQTENFSKTRFIYLKHPNVLKGSEVVSYFHNGSLETLKIDRDYTIDYKRGEINIVALDKIPDESNITVDYEYHDNSAYKIEFDKLSVDVANVKYISIPVKISDSNAGQTFSIKFNDVKSENGDLSPVPSNLKIQNIKLCEDFRYVKNFSSNLITDTIDKLGYKRELVINIGDGDYSNLKLGMTLGNTFNKTFREWYSQVQDCAVGKGITNAIIVVPMENKYLEKQYLQKTMSGRYLNKVNPINPFVIEYYSKLLDDMKKISDRISVRFVFKFFDYEVNELGNIGVFDDFTKNLFKTENPDISYLKKGSLRDFEKITTDNDIFIANWLSKKLRESFSEVTTKYGCGIAVDEDLVYNENYLQLINSIDVRWLSRVTKFYVLHKRWDKTSYNFIERINIAKNLFGCELSKLGYFIDIDEYYLKLNPLRHLYYKNLLRSITILEQEVDIKDIIVSSGHAVRLDSIMFYKVVPYVDLTQLDTELEIALCRANKKVMCYMPSTVITNISRVVDDVDKIELEVPFYVMDRFKHKQIKNEFYDDVKTERLLKLNEKEMFVIKSAPETISNTIMKKVTAYSLEHKLSKREFSIQDTLLQMYSEPGSEDDTLGIFNLLEEDTGWKIGYMDESVRMETVEDVKKAKCRWFENISTTWYAFLRDTVQSSFDCLIQYDTINKLINVYPATHVGDYKGLYLNEDNYIKSLEITDETEEIVTRMTCVGKEEMGIQSVNPSGQGFIENFSYFIENGDMSDELANALKKYDIRVGELNAQWSVLSDTRFNKNKTLKECKNEHRMTVGKITELTAIKESYVQAGDTANANRIQKDIDVQVSKKLDLEARIKQLEKEIEILDVDIRKINTQLSKDSVLDKQGQKIFTHEMLEELQEFIYHDTWSDDTYIDEKMLYDGGIIQLKDKCKPTTDYKIDLINFLERLGKKKGWDGVIYLRDVVMLKSNIKDKEVELYVVGFDYSPRDKRLTLNISNKFTTLNGIKTLGEILSDAKRASQMVQINKYVWQEVKRG